MLPPHDLSAALDRVVPSTLKAAAPVTVQVRPRIRGGLPPGALRRVCEYIEAHLEENISLQVLAGIAEKSKHHFARAFQAVDGSYPARISCAKPGASCAGTPQQDRPVAVGNLACGRVLGSKPLCASLSRACRGNAGQLSLVDPLRGVSPWGGENPSHKFKTSNLGRATIQLLVSAQVRDSHLRRCDGKITTGRWSRFKRWVSALPANADLERRDWHVCFVP